MNRLENRVEKLEASAGVGDKDSPVIGYMYHQADGEEGAATAQANAVAAWEVENGPLGDREPFFIQRCIVSPPTPKQAERESGMDQEPEIEVVPFLAR